MIARAIREWALAAACVALAFILGTVAMFIGAWCRDVSPTLATLPSTALSLKYAAEQSALASTETLDLIGSATKMVEHATLTVDEATGTIRKIRIVAERSNGAIDSIEGTRQRIDAAIDQYATIPEAVNGALEPLSDLQRSLTKTSDEAARTARTTSDYIHGPLTFATNNIGELSDSLNTSVQHVDQRWLKPWDGKRPFRHYMGLTLNWATKSAGGIALATR